jgi:cell division protein FtsI (penicillin-binding protein 3)
VKRANPPASRLVALFLVLTLGLGGVLFRLVVLQVKDASALASLALRQRIKDIQLPATRGTIYDRGSRALAMSLPAKAVFADPVIVDNRSREARVIASVLDLKRRTVVAKLRPARLKDGTPVRFVYLARGVDLQTAARLERKRLPGIGLVDESRRYYPGKDLASQVLGFVGTDGTGLDGLEAQYQDVLAGRPGHHVVEEDPRGAFIPQATNEDVPPVPGDDLLLTLDQEIQYQAESALASAVKSNQAKGGTVIVMDPHTGDILAMATYPWFDPSHFQRSKPSTWENGAVADVYEPGSVNKVITASAALETDTVRPNTTFEIPDHLQLYDHVFHDAHPHAPERMTLGDIIAYSSNVGAITVAGKLGRDRFSSYLHRFGFARTTGLGFPGESAGLLAPADRWSGTDMGSIPIGQGIGVTPLQMAAVYATIANGGVWVQPRLLRGTIGEDGRVSAEPTSPTRRVVSEGTARMVTRMLAYAVGSGTGVEAQLPGYWVAGKTGTARKPLPHSRGYSNKYMASFIGFLPASRPALVIAAILDEPATVFGGIASAPLFREIAHAAVARLRIPPAPKPPLPPHAVRAG